jgi:ABC-type antimicrobial peptide transport system permease subunit
MDLLEKMHGYAFAILFIGLIFTVVILLFVMISTLLIYSLLMITIETKAFENGIMRMQGLSKAGFSGMILL